MSKVPIPLLPFKIALLEKKKGKNDDFCSADPIFLRKIAENIKNFLKHV